MDPQVTFETQDISIREVVDESPGFSRVANVTIAVTTLLEQDCSVHTGHNLSDVGSVISAGTPPRNTPDTALGPDDVVGSSVASGEASVVTSGNSLLGLSGKYADREKCKIEES